MLAGGRADRVGGPLFLDKIREPLMRVPFTYFVGAPRPGGARRLLRRSANGALVRALLAVSIPIVRGYRLAASFEPVTCSSKL